MTKNGALILVVFHQLDNLNLIAQVRTGEIYLISTIKWSDRHHEIAAIMLAKKTRLVVIWQDITGTKHFVTSKSRLSKRLVSLDPRCRKSRHLQVV
jgi:hypothetical protein